jgi:membrane fusion protein (multidrug efflux system)
MKNRGQYNHFPISAALGGGLLALAIAFAGCSGKQAAPQAAPETPAVRVKAASVEMQPFAATVAVTGSLVSNTRVDVKAETTGRLVKFPKEEGESVDAGEVVAVVDDENYRLAERQAASAVSVAEAALARAKVAEGHSKTELERAENLMKSGGITDKDLKAAQVAEQDARAQVELASAQLEQARAALETARKHVRDASIHAPVSGQIQRKFVNVGAYVEPATAVMTLVNNHRLELESPVPSSDLAPIRKGQKVTFTVNSYPGETFEGRVIDLNPAVEADTRAAKVRIAVDNSSGKLKAGMFAQGDILTGVESQAIVIPASAAYRDDRSAKEAYVFVAENGRAVRRAVTLGREHAVLLEIRSGLKPGDVLILEQSIEVAEGVRVAPAAGEK